MNPPPIPHSVESPEGDPQLPESLDFKTLFEALLRQPQELVERLARPNHRASRRFLAITIGSYLLFGLVLGCFAKHEQLWAAPLKIVVGIAFSGGICFPSLYIFATLAGARVTISQLIACLNGALALAGLLLLGFAPAVWIFAESTDSMGFMGALAVGSWLIAVTFALRFLKLAVWVSGGEKKSPLVIWSGIFVLVSLQMTTSLRPILGRAETHLPTQKRFFLQHWSETVATTLPPKVPPKPQAQPAAIPAESSRNPYLENN
jgi:hypothetical protein